MSNEANQETALRELRDRGVTNPDEFGTLTAETVIDTCRWFDAQAGRVGPGVLVAELRSGGKPGWRPNQRRNLMDEQREYAAQIVDWLRQNFPEFDRPKWGPHPAAVAEVIRLHYRHGKGALTKRQHGPAIRAAVKAWEERWS